MVVRYKRRQRDVIDSFFYALAKMFDSNKLLVRVRRERVFEVLKNESKRSLVFGEFGNASG